MSGAFVQQFPGLVALEVIYEGGARDCTKCTLHSERDMPVFGHGQTEQPDLAFIGDGATRQESETGFPFAGDQRELLGNLLTKINFSYESIYALQATCCPPKRKQPTPTHLHACMPIVVSQLRAVRPRVIVALGDKAGISVVGGSRPQMGVWHELQGLEASPQPIPVMVVHSLTDMLATSSAKRTREETWGWLQLVIGKLRGASPS